MHVFPVNELCFSVLYVVVRVCVIYIIVALQVYITNEICNIFYFAYIYIYYNNVLSMVVRIACGLNTH